MDLHEACRLNNFAKVQQLIKEGENVNIRDVNKGENVLHVALGASYALFEFLLESGADVNAVDFFGNTLLHAIFYRIAHFKNMRSLCLHNEIVKYDKFISKCIAASIDVNKKNNFKLAPIHVAASNDLSEYMGKLLLSKNIDVNIQDGEGNTPMHRVAQMNNTFILNELIVKGADINIENFYNLTPFEVALTANPVALASLKFLLSKGINANHRSKNGNTALHIAVNEKRLNQIAITLINSVKLDINSQNENGDTVAHLAAKHGEFDVLAALIKKNVDSIVNNEDRTVLDLSVHNSRMIKLLLSCNVELNRQNAKCNTALHIAVIQHEKNDSSINELLSCYKVNINLQNVNGNTPLMIAVNRDDIECVTWLLERNCDVNILNRNGLTALMIAAKKHQMNEKRRKIIELLVNHRKTDLFITSNNGCKHLALHEAVLSANLFAAKCLLEKDVKLGAVVDTFNNLPIHIASSNGHYELVGLFCLKMPQEIINARGWHWWTPLHFAVNKKHFNIAELLVLRNANCNIADNYGNTPLHYVMKSYSQCCGMSSGKCKHKDKVNECRDIKAMSTYIGEVLNLNCAYLALICFMIEKGNADVNAQNIKGETPLDYNSSDGTSNYEFWSNFLVRLKIDPA